MSNPLGQEIDALRRQLAAVEAETIERCAKICIEHANFFTAAESHPLHQRERETALDLAAAIRVLKRTAAAQESVTARPEARPVPPESPALPAATFHCQIHGDRWCSCPAPTADVVRPLVCDGSRQIIEPNPLSNAAAQVDGRNTPRTRSSDPRAIGSPAPAAATMRDFFNKYALGSLALPSCLRCGHAKPRDKWAITHAELPDIYICAECATAALDLAAYNAIINADGTLQSFADKLAVLQDMRVAYEHSAEWEALEQERDAALASQLVAEAALAMHAKIEEETNAKYVTAIAGAVFVQEELRQLKEKAK